ncbi:MAG: NAD(P)-dependent oxidoreductase [Acidimicrobiia bacterium]|nr:NAD(P)-dependent oxidoreductase [Acidimicrobiia bacterium]
MSGLAGARAVVTGSAGFVGSHLVERLAGAGAAVVGVDRRPPRPGAPGCHVRLDLAEPGPALAELLRDADVVFHLAGRAGVRGAGPGAEAAYERDNVAATEHLFAATLLPTPVVLTSSSSVYGGARPCRGNGWRPSRESDRPAPRGVYARSKLAVERLAAARVARGGIVAVARPFTVAGEGQRPDMALARWLAAASEGTPLPVLGGLDRARDVTDVRDVVTALVLLAQRGPAVVNVGTGRPRTLAEMVSAVAAAVGRPVSVAVRPAGREEPRVTRADVSRCARRLGFVPRTDLEGVVARQLGASRAGAPGRDRARPGRVALAG